MKMADGEGVPTSLFVSTGLAVKYGGAVLLCPVDRGLEQRRPDAASTLFATYDEARHPLRVGIAVKDPGKCAVLDDPRKRRARHDPVRLSGSSCRRNRWHQHEVGSSFPGSKDSPQSWPPLSRRWHYTHGGHLFRILAPGRSGTRSTSTQARAAGRTALPLVQCAAMPPFVRCS